MGNNIKWTPNQQEIFDTKDKNLLVSASAGSGKTTVMIEKIIRLMLESNNELSISNFLIVTFTSASSEDMRQKLIDSLLKLEPTDYILKQIEDVETSDISTLDSFCTRLIRTYFYVINVDPNFKVIDSLESDLIKNDVITKLFDEKQYAGDKDFFELYEIFQQKRKSDSFKEIVIGCNNFLKSIVSPTEWLENTFSASYETDLSKNVCANAINHYVTSTALSIADDCLEYEDECSQQGQNKMYNLLVDFESSLRTLSHAKSYEINAKNLNDIKVPTCGTISKENVILKEKLSEFLEETKKTIKELKENMICSDQNISENLNEAKEFAQKLVNLVLEFDQRYSKVKHDRAVFDYSDLELFAIKLLQDEKVRQDIKKKYKYVFVDEYQDINEVQEKIISLISSKNNRFMVGDIKQSIYAFRLCEPDIFLNKIKEYKQSENSKVVYLNENFRSDKKILRFVDDVFCDVMTSEFGGTNYKEEGKFKPGENNLDNPNSMNLCFIDLEEKEKKKKDAKGIYSVKNHTEDANTDTIKIVAEANLVVEKINELTSFDNPNRIERKDIAILITARNNKINKLAEILRNNNIPVTSGDKNEFFSRPHIEEITNFVKLCVNKNDDILTFKVMKSKLFSFSNNEIAEVRNLDAGKMFYECVLLYENLQEENLRKKLQNFVKITEKYENYAKFLNVKDFVNLIINDFDIENIFLASSGGKEKYEDVKRLISLLPDSSVFDYASNIDNLKLDIEGSSAGDAVNIMTIHSSKGLEFKAVFLVNTDLKFLFSSTYGNLLFSKRFGICLNHFNLDTRLVKNTLPISATRLTEKRKIVEEKQRVLYVALTRAKEKLFVICIKDKNKLNKQFLSRPNCFMNWFEPIIYSEIYEKHRDYINFEMRKFDDLVSSFELEEKQFLLYEKAQEVNHFEYKFEGSQNIPLKTSVSKILQKNPKNLEKIDKNKENSEIFNEIEYEQIYFGEDDVENYISVYGNKFSNSADRGSAYHKLLQHINFDQIGSESEIKAQIEKIKSEVLSKIESDFIDEKLLFGILNKEFFKNLKLSKKILQEREFFAGMQTSNFPFKCKTNETFILQGVVDLIAVYDDEILILDYKTGKYSDAKIKNYTFQLDCYADVISRVFSCTKVRKFISFIDEQKLIEI